MSWQIKNQFSFKKFLIFRFGAIFLIVACFFCITGLGQRNYAANSVLASGNWYKIAVKQEGIYKIDVNFLNTIGINTTNLSSLSIKLFGNGGAMLDENNAIARPDDLTENAIEMFDGGDGIFNGNDYFLFYGCAADKWLKDSVNKRFAHQKNLYADSVFYYITIGGIGKRIQTQNINSSPTQTVSTYDERIYRENDLVNFLNSGKQWYGEEFSTIGGNFLTRNFAIDFTGLVTTQPVFLSTNFASRSVGGNANFTVSVNNQLQQNINMGSVTGFYLDLFATTASQQNNFLSSQSSLNISITYNSSVVGAQGWLDWFEVQGRKNLSMNNQNQVSFRDWQSVGSNNIVQFSINNTNANTEVWETTNPLQPIKISSNFSSSQTTFINDASLLREYVSFNNSNFSIPVSLGKIDNQNLHNSSTVDYIIITHSSFLSQAKQLALFHTQHDNYKTIVATTEQIFNEFSSGIPDPTALRDFIKMYYDKAGTDTTKRPKYVVLFGSSSFDYKNRINNNNNLIACYESINATDPLLTYTADDFFGFLDDNDNINSTTNIPLLDIGIGRLPVRNATEATTVVNKVSRYYSTQSFGPWRNQSVFVADDKDNNLHVTDAETIAADANLTDSLINQSKIYLDAYPLVSGSGGGRYPQVNNAIINQVFSGTFLFNYTGHGGYLGLAEEGILTQTELTKFNNANKLPLFITASCDFAPYDDPTKNSIGGSLLYGDNTGAIALLTTTRNVFANSNKIINENYIKIALRPDVSGKYLTLGESLKRTKNYTYQNFSDVINNRKFTLLGDPGMKLAFPEFKLQLTSINNNLNLTGNDTLKALNKYTMAGIVTDASGNLLNNFNGTVYPTVFDKPQLTNTLGNDAASPVMSFSQQTNILYKGKATVQNGLFNFSFIVPKDINYQVAKGKLSLYADDGSKDASGISTSFLVGGISNNIITDKIGPDIKIYLNDEKFVNGGLANESPVLIVNLFDSSGINTTGTGIGHDITLIIDGNDKAAIVLNNYYQAALNSYQQGKLNYQLSSLAEGTHTIKIKAWDVLNNSSEAIIEFIVAKKQKLQISHVLNYPNPFTTKTSFWFEHNQPGQNLNVLVNIFSISGKLVHQIRSTVNNAGNRSAEIIWNGKDESNEKLARGVYIYRIIVTSNNGSAEATQKLYLL
jgi:hypothetical protein